MWLMEISVIYCHPIESIFHRHRSYPFPHRRSNPASALASLSPPYQPFRSLIGIQWYSHLLHYLLALADLYHIFLFVVRYSCWTPLFCWKFSGFLCVLSLLLYLNLPISRFYLFGWWRLLFLMPATEHKSPMQTSAWTSCWVFSSSSKMYPRNMCVRFSEDFLRLFVSLNYILV